MHGMWFGKASVVSAAEYAKLLNAEFDGDETQPIEPIEDTRRSLRAEMQPDVMIVPRLTDDELIAIAEQHWDERGKASVWQRILRAIRGV